MSTSTRRYTYDSVPEDLSGYYRLYRHSLAGVVLEIVELTGFDTASDQYELYVLVYGDTDILLLRNEIHGALILASFPTLDEEQARELVIVPVEGMPATLYYKNDLIAGRITELTKRGGHNAIGFASVESDKVQAWATRARTGSHWNVTNGVWGERGHIRCGYAVEYHDQNT